MIPHLIKWQFPSSWSHPWVCFVIFPSESCSIHQQILSVLPVHLSCPWALYHSQWQLSSNMSQYDTPPQHSCNSTQLCSPVITLLSYSNSPSGNDFPSQLAEKLNMAPKASSELAPVRFLPPFLSINSPNHPHLESICQCRRCRFNSWVKKIPWRRKRQSTSVFLPGKSHGQKDLVG